MVKKSAVHGDYIISIEESGTVRVSQIYGHGKVTASLREIAATVGFKIEPQWNTQQTGAKLIKAYGEGSTAQIGEYTVHQRPTKQIDTYRTYGNTLGALREIAGQIGFEYDPKWTTRQFGNKLVDHLNQ